MSRASSARRFSAVRVRASSVGPCGARPSLASGRPPHHLDSPPKSSLPALHGDDVRVLASRASQRFRILTGPPPPLPHAFKPAKPSVRPPPTTNPRRRRPPTPLPRNVSTFNFYHFSHVIACSPSPISVTTRAFTLAAIYYLFLYARFILDKLSLILVTAMNFKRSHVISCIVSVICTVYKH